MNTLKEEQELRINYGRKTGLPYQLYSDPSFEIDRIDAIIDQLQNGADPAALELMRSKTFSPGDCWNLNFWLSMGRTTAEYIEHNDLELSL